MNIYKIIIIFFLYDNYIMSMDQQVTLQDFHKDHFAWLNFIDTHQQVKSYLCEISSPIKKEILTYDKKKDNKKDNKEDNKNIWYQYGKVINKNRVSTLFYSPDGKKLTMKSEGNITSSIEVHRLIQDKSIPQSIPFISGFTCIPFHMPYAAYDPVRPELAVANRTSKVCFWRVYQASTEQMLLGRTIQTWMCLEKPNKNIKNKILLLQSIAQKMNLNSDNVLTVWHSFPEVLRGYWLTQLYRQIQKYGK